MICWQLNVCTIYIKSIINLLIKLIDSHKFIKSIKNIQFHGKHKFDPFFSFKKVSSQSQFPHKVERFQKNDQTK